MSLPLAHAGHWLMSIGFAGAPLTVIAAVVIMALRERRRDADPSRASPHRSPNGHEVSNIETLRTLDQTVRAERATATTNVTQGTRDRHRYCQTRPAPHRALRVRAQRPEPSAPGLSVVAAPLAQPW